MRQYSENIQKLFDLGADTLDSINYQELGLNSSHSDELVAVALDDRLHYGDSTDENHLYAPIHAINTLAQLKISEPYSKIINLLNSYEDDDYLANAIISYAQILDKDITDNSFSSLANETITKALNKEEPKEEVILKVVEEEVVVQEVTVEEIPEVVKEVVVVQEVTVEETPEVVEEVVVVQEVTVNTKPKINKAVEPMVKVGRNEPCPCGSGKKYKKCCMNK